MGVWRAEYVPIGPWFPSLSCLHALKTSAQLRKIRADQSRRCVFVLPEVEDDGTDRLSGPGSFPIGCDAVSRFRLRLSKLFVGTAAPACSSSDMLHIAGVGLEIGFGKEWDLCSDSQPAACEQYACPTACVSQARHVDVQTHS
jgi:hypothetical protein